MTFSIDIDSFMSPRQIFPYTLHVKQSGNPPGEYMYCQCHGLIQICPISCWTDLTYNAIKSVCMVFKPKHYKLHCPAVYLGTDKLLYNENVKYLGVTLTSDCCDNIDIKQHTRKLYARVNSILHKFSRCSLSVKIQLFQSYCTNFYCAPLWSTYSSQVFTKLRTAYHNAYRYLLGYGKWCSASQMLVSNGLITFDALLRNGVYAFKTRVSKSQNSLVYGLFNNYTVNKCAMLTKWASLLYVS